MPDIPAIRKSEEKSIINQLEHDRLLPQYLKIIERLTSSYPVVSDEGFRELVNFKKNKSVPIHSWFDYKQGYAEELVKKLIQSSDLRADDYILDPFNGVGTSLLAGQALGYKGIGLDINPVADFAAAVKSHNYTQKEKDEIKEILSKINFLYTTTKHLPKYKKLNDIFNPVQLDQMMKIKGFYESLNKGAVQDFFKLGYLSIIEDVSNRVKDGNGIKISRTKQPILEVFKYYELKVRSMYSDIAATSDRPEVEIYQGSITNDDVYKKIKDKQIGAVIYSPPYANCFDYLEVYKMEVWLGEFVKEYEDFVTYRSVAVRSHVNSKFSKIIKNKNPDVDTVAGLISTYNVWNKNIPDMIRGYFDDMHEVIKRTYDLSRRGAMSAIVVANSGYKGVIVPTDLLLADISGKVGYRVKQVLFARNIRSSSQQMTELRHKNGLMRESIIILEK